MLQSGEVDRRGVTPIEVVHWKRHADVFSDIAAVELWTNNVGAQVDFLQGGAPDRLRGAWVTPNFFGLLGVNSQLGTLTPATGSDAAVLSYRTWISRFGGDPLIVGRPLSLSAGWRLDRRVLTVTVIGVLRPGVEYSSPLGTEIWLFKTWEAIAREPSLSRRYDLLGRLKPGLTVINARQRLRALPQLVLPDPNIAFSSDVIREVEPLSDYVRAQSRDVLLFLFLVAFTLVVVVSVNTSVIALASLAQRDPEFAIRSAVGATPAAIVRQVIAEHVAWVVWVACFAGGLILLLRPVFLSIAPAVVAQYEEQASILYEHLALAALSLMLCLLPAIVVGARALSRRLPLWLASAGGTHITAGIGAKYKRFALVGIPTLALFPILLLSMSAVSELWGLANRETGLYTARAFGVHLRLIDRRYYEADMRGNIQLQVRLREALRATPGIIDVALTSAPPFQVATRIMPIRRQLYEEPTMAVAKHIDGQFFHFFHIAVIEGKTFDDSELVRNPELSKVVISRTLARKLFGDRSPIGELSRLSPVTRFEIVGVAEDVRYGPPSDPNQEDIYIPAAERPLMDNWFLVRSYLPVRELEQAVRQAVRSVAPDEPVLSFVSLDASLKDALRNQRFASLALALVSVAGWGLLTLGVFAIAKITLEQRTGEIRIRRSANRLSCPCLRSEFHTVQSRSSCSRAMSERRLVSRVGIELPALPFVRG